MADALYIFTNDLRVNDNPQLQRLITLHQKGETSLHCAYVFDPKSLKPTNYNCRSIGPFRLLFLLQSLQNIASSVIKHGIPFHFIVDGQVKGTVKLIEQLGNTIGSPSSNKSLQVFMQAPVGTYERRNFSTLKDTLSSHNTKHDAKQGSNPSNVTHIELNTHNEFTLFDASQLPFDVDDIPNSFSKFRKKVEKLDLDEMFFWGHKTICRP